MNPARETLLLVLGAYLLGGISPGWWLVRRRAGIDLRKEGSGATGATNAARVLGRGGYAAVLLLDTLKGMAAVGAARWLEPDAPWALLVLPAVVAGHIWPVWLQFRGGRGAATLMGDFIALHWAIVPLAWIPGIAAGAIVRASGSAARRRAASFAARAVAFLASLPLALSFCPGLAARTSISAAWALVLLAHRSHFARKTALPLHGAENGFQDRHDPGRVRAGP